MLIQNLAARLVSTGHVTPTSRRVSKDPQPFAGDNKDIAKRQQEYVNWCSQIRLVFLQDGDMFTTDMKKILHVAGLLTGDAVREQRARLTNYTKKTRMIELNEFNHA